MGERLSPYPLYMAEDTSETVDIVGEQGVIELYEKQGNYPAVDAHRRTLYALRRLQDKDLSPEGRAAYQFSQSPEIDRQELVAYLNQSKLPKAAQEACVQLFTDRQISTGSYYKLTDEYWKAEEIILLLRVSRTGKVVQFPRPSRPFKRVSGQ